MWFQGFVLGFDGRIANIQFAKEAMLIQGEPNIFEELKSLEYAIQWGTMTLQDGIDFLHTYDPNHFCNAKILRWN